MSFSMFQPSEEEKEISNKKIQAQKILDEINSLKEEPEAAFYAFARVFPNCFNANVFAPLLESKKELDPALQQIIKEKESVSADIENLSEQLKNSEDESKLNECMQLMRKKGQLNIAEVKELERIAQIENSTYKVSANFFPFSNEIDFKETVKDLADLKSSKQGKKLRVALLVGESNILSVLPELLKHVDIILCDDVDPRVILHIKHLLNCLNLANNPKEFLALYSKDNPVKTCFSGCRLKNGYIDMIMLELEIILKSKSEVLGEKHFLSSSERFQLCKEASQKLKFAFANKNLMQPEKCKELADIMEKNQTSIEIINVTNLHEYDKNQLLKSSLEILCKGSDNPHVLFSKGDKLVSHIEPLTHYYQLLAQSKKTDTQTFDPQVASVLSSLGSRF